MNAEEAFYEKYGYRPLDRVWHDAWLSGYNAAKPEIDKLNLQSGNAVKALDAVEYTQHMQNTAKSEWISVDTRLPKSNVPVIAYVENAHGNKNGTRRVRAQYAAPKSLELSDECDGCDGEYDEEQDKYFCAEGWYETNEFDETNWWVHGTVTYWTPLPPPPAKAA